MKVDAISSIYFCLFISVFIMTLSYAKVVINKLKNKVLSYCIRIKKDIKIFQFLIKLVIEDCVAYEKYDIWRFCVED